jgi:FkbM family methyltransferase
MGLKNQIHGLKEILHFDNSMQLIMGRLFFRENGLNIYRKNGMSILVDHQAGDQNGARNVLVSPMYKQYFPKMKLDRKLNVLDIGANGAGFALLLNMEKFQLKKVACIEFNPNTFSRMRFNMERNLSCELQPMNIAICGENTTLEVWLGSGSTGENIYETAAEQPNAKKYRIPGLTLDAIVNDAFANETIDICKMDVEGAEYDVFATPHHISLRKCRYLIIEIHQGGKREPKKIENQIIEMGFEEIPEEVKADGDVYVYRNKNLDT